MKRYLPIVILFFLAQTSIAQYKYPASKTVDSSSTYWGVKVQDPYRWLENLKDPEGEKWFKAQGDYTNEVLAKIPNQQKIVDELKNFDQLKSDLYTPIAKAGGRYFYDKRSANDQVAKIYYRQGLDGKEILLFDPQKFVEGKTYQVLPKVSDDGSRIILNLSEEGSEVGDIHIFDIKTGKFLPDVIKHSAGGTFANTSNSDIIYWESPNYDVHDEAFMLNNPTKLHVLGTPASADLVIASAAKYPNILTPVDGANIIIFKNSPFVFLSVATVETNLTVYYAPIAELKAKKINWKPLCKTTDEVKQIFAHGNDIYLLTSRGNSMYRLIKAPLQSPDLGKAKVIAEGKDGWKISDLVFAQTKDYLIFNKSKNELLVQAFAYEFKTGKLTEINVPLSGNVYGGGAIDSYFSKDDNGIVLINSGWNIPINYFSYNVETKSYSKGIFNSRYDYPGLENIVSEEIEVPSHDGELVPLSIVYDKNKLKKDGTNIGLMMGYGAYGATAFVPQFGPSLLPLLNRGVVLAFAHVRGGGEKGEAWHIGGMKGTKPNTWKDFNACAEYLIKNKYTSAKKLGIESSSAGGILIGRAITERPDLYRVAIPKVGILNAVRFELTPNGIGNVPEFGTVKDEKEFRALLEMDAYEHIVKGTKYPAQLITTGWNDPRVTSYIPAKFAARMQAANTSESPVLLQVDYDAGHFGGSTRDERYAQIAREYAFLLWQCGDKDFIIPN